MIGRTVVHRNKFLSGLIALGIFSIDSVSAQSNQESHFVKQLKGNSTLSEKVRLEKLFSAFAAFAKSQDEMTLNRVVAATEAEFKEPVCFTANTGANSCSHDNINWDVRTFSVSGLRTISKNKESDMGAQLRMQIERKYICVPSSAVDKFWNVKPVQGPALVPDSFGNSDSSTDLIKTTFYRGINPSAPYVYVETKSIAGCVTDVILSTVRQPI